MELPLSVMVDFLEENGYEIAYSPKNQKVTFSWVSSLSPSETNCPKGTLFVTDSPTELSASSLAILIGNYQPKSVKSPSIIFVRGEGVTTNVLAEQAQRYVVSIYQWVEELHNIMADGGSCEQILASSEPILKNYISVSDSLYRYIAHTPGIGPIEEESRYFVENGRYRSEAIELALKSNMGAYWEKSSKVIVYAENAINKCPSIEHVFHLNNQYAAHLLMVCPKPITEGQAFLFSLLIKPIGAFLKFHWATSNPFRQRYTSFLSSLIRQDQSRRDVVERQAAIVDIPTSGVFKVIAIDNAWRGGSSTYYAARITSAIPGCWVLIEEEATLVLIHVDKEKKANRLLSVEDEVFSLVKAFDSKAGVSQKFFELADMRSAAAEARIALRYGKVCYRHFLKPGQAGDGDPISYIFRFKRYFPFLVGDPDADLGKFLRRHNIADKIIGAIEREDKEKGTIDLPILHSYLHYGGRISAVCKDLGLHRNTVLYRIKHIEETYDLDLSDPDECRFVSTLCTLPL